jgi:hypothetical protein
MSLEIKIPRLFSAKVNTGNYENVDISCSAEAVTIDGDAEAISHWLKEFCRNQVRQEVDAIKRRKGGANA